jgi:acetyltransferase
MGSRYPEHLAREHRLVDGRTVRIRPIRRDDDTLERDFLNALSGESRYQRFHIWVRAPSDKLVHMLTDIDHDTHVAWVCTTTTGDREELLGEARYVCNPDGASCEFGVMIADDWRKTGIAGILMQALLDTARERGLSTMEGLVLRNNTKMLRFVRGLGFGIHPIPEDLRTVRVVRKL